MTDELTWDQRSVWQERPNRTPVMYQSWRQLAFLHWQVCPRQLQESLPAGLRVDTFQGTAWLGVVPFQMRRIRPLRCPAVPYISNFLELNLRTYVIDESGRPGVWFYSLSANRFLAVLVARRRFHLPYFWNRMSNRTHPDGWIDYSCQQMVTSNGEDAKRFQFRYRPVGEPSVSAPGSLEFFLVERYLLFADDPRRTTRLGRGQVHHSPYQVTGLQVERCDSSIVQRDGREMGLAVTPKGNESFQADPEPDHVLFSPGVDVQVYGLQYD